MSIESTFAKVDEDLKLGRKGMAVKRLRSLIRTYPHENRIRERLADIYYEAGFHDRAGLYWLLSKPKNNQMRECVFAYEQAHKDKHIFSELSSLIVKEYDADKFDEYAQSKLKQYGVQVSKNSDDSVNNSRTSENGKDLLSDEFFPVWFFPVLLVMAIFVPFLIGVYVLLRWIIGIISWTIGMVL